MLVVRQYGHVKLSSQENAVVRGLAHIYINTALMIRNRVLIFMNGGEDTTHTE